MVLRKWAIMEDPVTSKRQLKKGVEYMTYVTCTKAGQKTTWYQAYYIADSCKHPKQAVYKMRDIIADRKNFLFWG